MKRFICLGILLTGIAVVAFMYADSCVDNNRGIATENGRYCPEHNKIISDCECCEFGPRQYRNRRCIPGNHYRNYSHQCNGRRHGCRHNHCCW